MRREAERRRLGQGSLLASLTQDVEPKEEPPDVKPRRTTLKPKPKQLLKPNEEPPDVKPRRTILKPKPKQLGLPPKAMPRPKRTTLKPKEEPPDVKPKEEPLEVKPKEEPLDAEAEEEDQPAPTRSRPCSYRRLQLPGREDRPAPAGEDQPAATRYVEVHGLGGQWTKIVLAKEEADIDEGEPAMRRLRSSSRHRRGRAGDEAAYYVQPRRGHRRGRAGDEAAEVFQPIEELDECNEECRDEDSVAHTEASEATEAQRRPSVAQRPSVATWRTTFRTHTEASVAQRRRPGWTPNLSTVLGSTTRRRPRTKSCARP